ncbi:LysR family transcriptional regulator [Ovoidimarina sediminis]|uniref:LysR family transcriptional regulator n=1 Tax=Ovoidimarina sediminis TaxID=3079856 RepID=UPI002911885B|nr:LysR family transcriptional regulator [Rhodophyticola sp. MJ-SS7]MDU8944791.1 LysR family transcriptional regulator [Rhodophyticola sp. MJ-SS7]
MENWDEIRTAYHVARAGTVSGAAEALGVHHATVIRHVDALEGRLGVKLFQRHARGYTPTEAGEDLMIVAQATDDQITQLVGRIKGRGDDVSGELVVTSLSSISPLVSPTLVRFQEQHPGLIVRYLTGDRVFRLEYGEAHVAIRAGAAPDQPDNVVQPFGKLGIGLYASEEYVAAHGQPADESEFAGHRFVGGDNENSRAPFNRWLRAAVAPEQITFRCFDNLAFRDAIRAGAGIGFMSKWDADRCPDIVEICPPRDEWSASFWLVTHVDLHRTTKVQTFLKFLKEEAKGWQIGL